MGRKLESRQPRVYNVFGPSTEIPETIESAKATRKKL